MEYSYSNSNHWCSRQNRNQSSSSGTCSSSVFLPRIEEAKRLGCRLRDAVRRSIGNRQQQEDSAVASKAANATSTTTTTTTTTSVSGSRKRKRHCRSRELEEETILGSQTNADQWFTMDNDSTLSSHLEESMRIWRHQLLSPAASRRKKQRRRTTMRRILKNARKKVHQWAAPSASTSTGVAGVAALGGIHHQTRVSAVAHPRKRTGQTATATAKPPPVAADAAAVPIVSLSNRTEEKKRIASSGRATDLEEQQIRQSHQNSSSRTPKERQIVEEQQPPPPPPPDNHHRAQQPFLHHHSREDIHKIFPLEPVVTENNDRDSSSNTTTATSSSGGGGGGATRKIINGLLQKSRFATALDKKNFSFSEWTTAKRRQQRERREEPAKVSLARPVCHKK